VAGEDSSLAPGGPGFLSTAWSVIRHAQGADDPQRARAMERLMSVYWRPVYWTLRLDWNAGPEDARDLTQTYFAEFLERDLVSAVDPSRGRFRQFVKATLKNFMLTRKRAEATIKRGGGRHIVALDDLATVEQDPMAASDTPERRFDRELMRAIVKQSLADLERACEQERKADHFELYRAYDIDSAAGGQPSYDEMCSRFGIGLHDVKNRLTEMRARFRETVLGYLRDGISTEEELLSEIREVFEA
jgi:RNA polymerase sigma-70 factor (ECF subfamily)